MEQEVAGAVMQRQETITINDHTYRYPRPNLATIMEASEDISKLPEVKIDEKGYIVEETLRIARHYRVISKIVAKILVGVRYYKFPIRRFFYRLFITPKIRRIEDRVMNDIPPADLKNLFLSLLGRMQCADFFAITTFLQGINVIKPTRKVESKTTVSGQEFPVSANGTE